MLPILINGFILLVILLHIWFFILEAILWQKNLGRKIFKLDPAFAKRSAHLAINQGVYNLFLAAGLFWGLINPNLTEAYHLKLFFLSCVIIAAIIGWLTVNYRIIIIQGLPATIAFLLLQLHNLTDL